MATQKSLVPLPAPSTMAARLAELEAENERLAGLLGRFLAVQERTVEALARLAPPVIPAVSASVRPLLRVVR